MAAHYQLTPRALQDLDDIWSFIAADSRDAADRVEAAILEACEMLSRRPLMGSLRTDITSQPVRFWSVTRFRNYVIVYRPATKPLQIVTVLHNKRDISRVVQEGAPS